MWVPEKMPKTRTSYALKKHISRLYSRAPFIGWELRRRAVRALGKNGSAEAMNALSGALVRHDTRRLHKIILNTLLDLAEHEKPEAQDALCRLMLEHNHPLARKIVFDAQYVPHNPQLREQFIEMLTQILLRNHDQDLYPRALHFLEKIAEAGNVEAREALCYLVIDHNHPRAREIVLASHYVPQNPYQQAVFYILTAQWEKYETLDFDRHLLRTAYKLANKPVQKRIAIRTRQGGRADLLASFVTEGKEARKMTDEDWDAILAALNRSGEWAELWRLAQSTPVIWSVRLLLRLKEIDWTPKEQTERTEFMNLIQLAEICYQQSTEAKGWLLPCLAKLEGYADVIQGFAFSPDGQILASGNKDRTLHIWNLPDEIALPMLNGHINMSTTYLPYYAYRRRTSLKKSDGHVKAVTCLAINSRKKILASGSKDTTVRLWSWPRGMPLKTLKGHSDNVCCLAFNGNFLISGGEDNTIQVWNLTTGISVKTFTVNDSRITSLALSPDGQLAISGHEDGLIRLWSLKKGKLLQILEGHTAKITCFTISPDGKKLASGSHDHNIRVWHLSDGRSLAVFCGHTAEINQLIISPDGQVLISGSSDQTLRVWSLFNGKALKILTGHSSGTSSLAISPDGRMMASAGYDKTVALWALETIDLRHLIPDDIQQEELYLLQQRVQEAEVTETELKWLDFILALMHWRQRFDIELGELLRGMPHQGFDIEIE